MASGKFAAAINCIDGRAQRPVSEWIRVQFAIDFVDTITQPGPEKALIHGPQTVIAALRQNVGVSVNAHHSQLIAVAAHFDCAGNPVSHEEHKAQVKAACQVIAEWGYPARVVGLWVNEWWQIEVVADSGQMATISQ
ncbi:MAG TPA: carbonic anhydrase [Ktedonobacterales bacterium]|nr:carbonic anhydrase [Ktedonobacterales bacterium]